MMTPTDKICISRIACPTVIGVTAPERTAKQNLYIDLEFAADIAKAASQDSIEDAVDYDTVARAVAEVCAGEEFHLIETVAEKVAARVLAQFATKQVRVLVRKISPIAAPRVEYVSVEIVRAVSP